MADGRPHLVPVVFAQDGQDLVTAIDSKPKTGRRLIRLVNIGRDPRVCLLGHHYEEDWTRLWWVRVDGSATLEGAGEQFERAIRSLRERYRQYEVTRLEGPVIRIAIERVSGWRAVPR
jgi:PPOX class probable F420-dependent enzyme